jgi:protein-disulfide isomerase
MRSSFFAMGLALTLVLPAAEGFSADDEVVARIGETAITRADLEKEVKAQLIEIDNARYEALKGGLDRMIGEKLFVAEAKARGITVEALVAAEIKAKVKAPTDEEIASVYEASKAELGDATLDQVKPQIVQFLSQRQEAVATRELVDQLRAKYKPEVKLQAPRIEIATGDLEGRGPANAPITIIAFSDYECPYCKRAEETVEAVIAAYPDKIRYYHRDFPLDFHANARPAAEAARCANAQGKFWAFRTALFASPGLGADRLLAIADETGVDRTKFDECLASDQFSAAIDVDMTDGANVGVNGTPAFFVNGRMLSGAQPAEAFKEIIDAELATKAAVN